MTATNQPVCTWCRRGNSHVEADHPLPNDHPDYHAFYDAGDDYLAGDGVRDAGKAGTAMTATEQSQQPPTDAPHPSPRQPAYDAVYVYIRSLGDYLPADTVHRNATIWRAVTAALDTLTAGDCETHWGVDHGGDVGVVRYQDEASARRAATRTEPLPVMVRVQTTSAWQVTP